MSNDTSREMTIIFHDMIMKRSPIERLFMGFSMYNTSREIVKSSILAHNPEITSQKMKEEIFLRFYGMDFSEVEKEKILGFLRKAS